MHARSCGKVRLYSARHRQVTRVEAYKDIFAITIIKTLAVLVIIGVFYATGIV